MKTGDPVSFSSSDQQSPELPKKGKNPTVPSERAFGLDRKSFSFVAFGKSLHSAKSMDYHASEHDESGEQTVVTPISSPSSPLKIPRSPFHSKKIEHPALQQRNRRRSVSTPPREKGSNVHYDRRVDEFKKLWSDPDRMHMFRRHLIWKHADESLDFMDACHCYKSLENVSDRERKSEEIISMYVMMEAPRSVNLNHDVVTRIKETVEIHEYPKDLFQEAHDQIFFILTNVFILEYKQIFQQPQHQNKIKF